MASQLYMSRQRWIATLVLAASVLLFWWAIGVRLGGATDMERQHLRQEAHEFRINTLR